MKSRMKVRAKAEETVRYLNGVTDVCPRVTGYSRYVLVSATREWKLCFYTVLSVLMVIVTVGLAFYNSSLPVADASSVLTEVAVWIGVVLSACAEIGMFWSFARCFSWQITGPIEVSWHSKRSLENLNRLYQEVSQKINGQPGDMVTD